MGFLGPMSWIQVLVSALLMNGWWVCEGANLPPVFTLDINNLALAETTPVGTVVFTLEGSDPENSTVHFGLNGTDLLKVNRDTGAVTVVKPLDREINDTLNFSVTLEDEVQDAPVGGNNLVTVPVTVIILDENDNAPMFQNVPYEINVKEDEPIGSTVFSEVVLSDPDSLGESIEVECINLPGFERACEIFELQAVESSQNTYKGVFVLKKKLNYTMQDTYEILLKATDGQLNSTVKVNVNVEDVQDTPPKFIGELEAQIYENASINTLVLTLHAVDGDRQHPRKIHYELVNNPMNYFLLDSVTGELRTAKPLDRESIDNPDGILTLNIKAREIIDGQKGNDPLTVTTADVKITVKDVNDEPPTFNKRDYYVEIPENIPEGSALPDLDMTVNDPDLGENSEFSLALNDISNAFSIEPKSATGSTPVTIRVTNSSLDYENLNQRKFLILVVAKELHTAEQLSSTATVTITVTDANDNAPTFDQDSYVATISEISSPGSLVSTIVARDRDSGRFGENGILYSLAGNGAEKFHVNNRTGAITVAKCSHPGEEDCLDYETKSEYLLSFKATDDDGKGQTSIVPLKIVLTDNNDNPPVFGQDVYRVFIDEGATRFDPDLVITATDKDKTSRLTYSIIAGNADGSFYINPDSGRIRITKTTGLDMSNADDLVLTVEANDGKYTASALVNITVRDINNNSPKFEEENYVVAVKEDVAVGSSVIQVNATDADVGLNADVLYKLTKGSLDDFNIDPESGIVTVSSKLDYDRRNTYNIEVVATDKGSPALTGTATLTVNIINTNDKLPYFVPTTQKAEVLEDAPVGTVVHTLVALDPDVNGSEALNFAATEPITALDKHGHKVEGTDGFKDFFSVDKNNGKVTVVNPLLRDIAAVIRITVLVTDITATNMQQGEGMLIITITDVNDSPPAFTPPWTPQRPFYDLQLKEELPVGTIVSTYNAYDEDSEIAGYTIWPQSEYFEINNGTGIVQIKKVIDFEQTENLNFTIVAFDSGVPQLNTSATIRVTVVNINDNDPKFSKEMYNVSVEENIPKDAHIVTVNATDADAGEFGKITYNLTGEHSENFKIDQETGEVTVENPNFLDREVLEDVTIQVVASDGAPGNLKRTVSVPIHIFIRDVNDNAPKFNQSSYNATVVENVRLNPPVPIVTINATDGDVGINGIIKYKILTGNEKNVFLLAEDTGILYPHKSLIDGQHVYNLLVEARDVEGTGKLSDRAMINIEVQNVNEFKPAFIMPALLNSTVEIIETAAIPDFLVMTVKATDKDSGENGRITYHLRIDGENVQETEEFAIEEKTGELKCKRMLDREVQGRYELVLVARDHGMPKWFETVRYLTILLVDMNDNRPEFPDTKTTNPYIFYVDENDEKNLRIGQVKALDRDEGKHAKVYYYMLAGDEDHAFRLDKLDGSLYTNKSFDREEKSEYNLFILANNDPDFYLTDEDRHRLSDDEIMHDIGVAKVLVVINDKNDNAPKFVKPTYYAAVNAMANINNFIANVSAIDPDAGPNGTITYYIKASNLYKYGSDKSSGSIIPSPFNISQTGHLNTATYLAENNQHRFVVDVVARENAFPERETIAKVHIWIFEPTQLNRIILSRPVTEVKCEREEIIAELSNATGSLVIIDDIRYHTDDLGRKNEEWSDMYILVIDPNTHTIVPVPEVLKIIDAKYDFLKDYYAGFAIQNVVPAFATEKEEAFDPALAALIALLIVLVVGIVTFTVVCCCLRHWSMPPNGVKKKDALIKKAIIDDLNTTENPLWIEQKLKIYEEQELTMQVFNEPEQNRRNSEDFVPDDNTYATIQHPNRRGSVHMATLSMADEMADYATLSGMPLHSNSSTLRGSPNYYEAAMGFQGSTFQVPEPVGGSSEDFNTFNKSRFKHDKQSDYVAELI
ncbi:PREDICTED: cadherin-87A isoform X2 [Nicrophorus vespilloides]|uniref:Cadherin-87A isoform X2 n=1 Tax=Nicrophorus vespilloides TaxID=110193 RepID=A0ABM1LZT9_NICVS|nr:PREDICTED: cadherin-87A isoform X2 [Nicrophorus vespilloides]